jgi:hypothetical protein
MRTRIMYIEDKSQSLTGPCRIGRVRFSKSGATLYYGDRAFKSLTGSGFKANYFDQITGDHFWISGPRRDGADGLYGRVTQPDDVDADVADTYWRDIRGRTNAPTVSGKQGHDVGPSAENRLQFEERDTVEHKQSTSAEREGSRYGRKAGRIERQQEAPGPLGLPTP